MTKWQTVFGKLQAFYDEIAQQAEKLEVLNEFRDICPLNENETPLEILSPEVCWEIGPYEGRLATLQAQIDSGGMKRVALRDLFEKECDGVQQ